MAVLDTANASAATKLCGDIRAELERRLEEEVEALQRLGIDVTDVVVTPPRRRPVRRAAARGPCADGAGRGRGAQPPVTSFERRFQVSVLTTGRRVGCG